MTLSISTKMVKFKLVMTPQLNIYNHSTNASAGDISRSILPREIENFAQDVEAVYSIATTFLDFLSSLKLVNMSGLAVD